MKIGRILKISGLFLMMTASAVEFAAGKDAQILIAQNPAPKEADKSAVQFCQGKYNLPGVSGVEVVTVRCPGAEDRCSCAAEQKSLKEFVACGGKKKNATDGANLVSCDSIIVGGGAR